MIYRSNITAPDLTPFFPHLHVRPMPHAMGHSIPSDWADKPQDDPVFGLYKKCGLWSHDEAAILYTIASRVGGIWIDIGSHTGWTTCHIAVANCHVIPIDPMYRVESFAERASDNMRRAGKPNLALNWNTSDAWFGESAYVSGISGVVIDGDHCDPHPTRDAENAHRCLLENGVIVFHDAIGAPVWRAARMLMDIGYKARFYCTPHGVIVCWREGFTPPDHVPDPLIDWARVKRLMDGFPFSRCE